MDDHTSAESQERQRTLLARLREVFADAGPSSSLEQVLRVVQLALGEASERAAGTDKRLGDLERRLNEVEVDGHDLALRLVESEKQAAKLMSLYVATYQLHSTLDPQEVRGIIAEIAINLLGADRFVLLLRADSGRCDVVLAEGLVPDADPELQAEVYAGGVAMIDGALGDGVLRIASPPVPDAPLAVVPLVVQGAIVGALVVLKLLDHRLALGAGDRDLLELLGAHAASALFAAQVHATADRKLRTLETLVKLAKKS